MTARSRHIVTRAYVIVDDVAGLDRAPSEGVAPEHISEIIARLVELDVDLAVPFAPDRAPSSFSDAAGEALESAAECDRAIGRADLPPASRALVGLLRDELINVAGGLVGKSSHLTFARLGRTNERMRGWAAFIARAAELHRKESL